MMRRHLNNFVEYVRDFGFRGALSIVRGKTIGRNPEYALHVPGARHSLLVRRNSSDFLVLRQVVAASAVAKLNLVSPRLMIDAGANVGYTSALLASQFPAAHIVAVEPESCNYQQLVKNTARYANVYPRCAAVWPRSARLSVENPSGAEWEYRMVEDVNGTIEGVEIGELIDSQGVEHCDLLKVDIEGGEWSLFGPEARAWMHRIGTLMVELHDRIRPGCTERLEAALPEQVLRDTQIDEYRVIRLT